MRWIFWGFCRNWFLMSPLHYLSRSSDFGFEFVEIFVIEKRKSKFLKFIMDSPNFKQLKQPFKRPISQKIRQGCHVLSPLFYLKVWKNCIYRQSCRLTDSAIGGVVFWFRISPWIRSQNRNGSKCSLRDLCQTCLCKNPRKSASLPCPFKGKPNFYCFTTMSQSMSTAVHMEPK